MQLPFMATIVFTRGKFCQHGSMRQCSNCFITAMHQYDSIIDIDALIKNYMSRYKQANIDLADSLTCLI